MCGESGMSLFPHVSLFCKNKEIPRHILAWLNFICTFCMPRFHACGNSLRSDRPTCARGQMLCAEFFCVSLQQNTYTMHPTNPLKPIARLLLKLPAWAFTTLVTAAILWLTLAPDPLPDNELPLFPGLDKVAHACMFGGLYFAASFDWMSRRRGGTPPFALPSTRACAAIAAATAAFGGAIELLQGAMDMGRGCDPYDFAADIAGVAAAVLLTPAVLRAMLPPGRG